MAIEHNITKGIWDAITIADEPGHAEAGLILMEMIQSGGNNNEAVNLLKDMTCRVFVSLCDQNPGFLEKCRKLVRSTYNAREIDERMKTNPHLADNRWR